MQNTTQLFERMLGSVFLDLSHLLSQCHSDRAFGTVNGMKHWIVIKLWIDRRKGWDRRLVFAKIKAIGHKLIGIKECYNA